MKRRNSPPIMPDDDDDQPETDSSPLRLKYHKSIAAAGTGNNSSGEDVLVSPKLSLLKADSKESMAMLSNSSDHTSSTVGETSHASVCSSCSDDDAKEEKNTTEEQAPPLEQPICSNRSSLSVFFSQLLGDRTNQIEPPLVQDNARAHGDKLGLVRRRSIQDFAAMQGDDDVLPPSAFQFQDMIVSIIDDNTRPQQQRPPMHPRIETISGLAAVPKSAMEEQRQEPAALVRVPQRPCRWSPNNSFNKGAPATPNSPPLKVDNSPTLPARRLSSDGLMTAAPLMADALLLSPSEDSSESRPRLDVRDVLAMLEHEESGVED